MRKSAIILSVAFLISVVQSCKKDSFNEDCKTLQQGLKTNDENSVRLVITNMIQELPSQDYTNENFEKLVDKISSQCNIYVMGKCFDCIQTLPSQSEIYLLPDSVGGTHKVIDLSYTSDNKMKFHNLHD